MTTERLTKKEAERIRKIAEKISNAFLWDRTKEKYEYWEKVNDALHRIADKGEENLK